MIRRTAPCPTGYDRGIMVPQARVHWPKLVDVNEVALGVPSVAFYFNDPDVPTQADVDAFVLTYDPTPPPPTAEETLFAQSVAQLRATFNTARTSAQANNSIDALTVILRRVFRELS